MWNDSLVVPRAPPSGHLVSKSLSLRALVEPSCNKKNRGKEILPHLIILYRPRQLQAYSNTWQAFRHLLLGVWLQVCRPLQQLPRASKQRGCTVLRAWTEECECKGHRAKPFMSGDTQVAQDFLMASRPTPSISCIFAPKFAELRLNASVRAGTEACRAFSIKNSS